MSSRSPASILYDADGNPVAITTDGVNAISIRDEAVLGVLREILAETKKTRWLVEQALDISLKDVNSEEL